MHTPALTKLTAASDADMLVDLRNETDVVVDEAGLVAQAQFLMKRLGLGSASEVSVLLTSEEHMEQLHLDYMDEPGATDVLSFPMDELAPDSQDEGMLGDIVLCPAFAQRQANEAGHDLAAELRLLLTHGMLHLLGHDHAEPHEHVVMFGLQATLLAEWEASRG